MTDRQPRGREAGEALGQGFNLFAETVLLGLLVVLGSLPVLTWFTAFAAGGRSLDRYLSGGQGVGLRPFLRDMRAVLPGTLAVGSVGVAATAVVAADVWIASGGLPGGTALVALLAGCSLAAVVVLLRTAVTWQPDEQWWRQTAQGAGRAAADLAGSALLAGGVLVVVVTTWQLLPLVVPATGCLVMAGAAVGRRLRHVRAGASLPG